MTTLRVLSAGLQTTVQDRGRFGFARSGVPVAGALDAQALVAANRAVGNPDDAAGLECLLRGPTLAADAQVWFAAVGAGWSQGPEPRAAGVPYTLGALSAGLRCWVAVSGGITVAPVLGSRSTDTLSHLGGRLLADGDELPLGVAGRPGKPPPAAPALSAGPVTLRVLPGPQAEHAGSMDGTAFTVSSRSDRTALRFDGVPLHRRPGDIATVGVVPGAVQLPPDGLPILLMGNCQTTGGYPVVAAVVAGDLRKAAQLRPGADVRFALVTLAAARALTAQAAD
jgi:biotin-dependent carboxylase-like uncharacterized protein